MHVEIPLTLTDEQQTLLEQIATSELPEGATHEDKIAWGAKLAAEGLKTALERLGVASIDKAAQVAQNEQRQTFLTTIESAWAEETPVEEAPIEEVVVEVPPETV